MVLYPSAVSVTGSVAAVYNPDLYGASVFRPKGEVGDIDIVITTTNIPESLTEAQIYGKPIPLTVKTRDGRTICVVAYINGPLEILQIPAAAYSIYPKTSYIVRRDKNTSLDKLIGIVTKNIEKHTHPIQTAIDIGIRDPRDLINIYTYN